LATKVVGQQNFVEIAMGQGQVHTFFRIIACMSFEPHIFNHGLAVRSLKSLSRNFGIALRVVNGCASKTSIWSLLGCRVRLESALFGANFFRRHYNKTTLSLA
jgi:hypothetical protein